MPYVISWFLVLTLVLSLVQSALSALPFAAGWFTSLAGLSWGIGFVILVVGAVVLHALLAMTRNAARQ